MQKISFLGAGPKRAEICWEINLNFKVEARVAKVYTVQRTGAKNAGICTFCLKLFHGAKNPESILLSTTF